MATILLIDDDRVCQRLGEKIFGAAGPEVLSAGTARGGLELLMRTVLVDLVILDNQLDGDWGWTFLAEARLRPYFKDLPVVVYSGAAGREDVMRYLELGVQAFLMKPYRADLLLAELQKTLKTDRMQRLMLDPAEVCRRLGISARDYAGLLNAAVMHREEDRRIARERLRANADPLAMAALDRMRAGLSTLGVGMVSDLVGIAVETMTAGNLGAAADALGMLDALGDLLRHRALAILEMENAVPSTEGARGWSRTGSTLVRAAAPALGGAVRPERPAGLSPGEEETLQRMIGGPRWKFGGHLGRLTSGGYITAEELMGAARARAGEAPLSIILDAIRQIESVPDLDNDRAALLLASIQGFEPACTRILLRIGILNQADKGVDWAEVVRRLGTGRAAVLAAVGRMARARFDNPVDLDGLRHEALTLAVLSQDIGKLLKLASGHRLASAALARGIGRWVFAATEPGLTALSLALVLAGTPQGEAERAFFGMDHGAAGGLFMASLGFSDLLVEVATHAAAAPPDASPENQITLAVVALAEDLVGAVIQEGGTAVGRLRSVLLDPGHPTWELLREREVTLPVDLVEFVDLLVTLARAAHWITREATL